MKKKKKMTKGKKIILGISIPILLVVIVMGGIFAYNLIPKKSSINLKDFKHEEFKEEATSFNDLTPLVYILNTGNDKLETTKKYFYEAGFDVASGDVKKLKEIHKDDLIIVVNSKELPKLSKEETEYVVKHIESGKYAILSGEGDILKELGITLNGKSLKSNTYVWNDHKDIPFKLKEELNYKNIEENKDLKVLANVKENPIMVLGNKGEGKFIYSSADVFPKEGEGYEICPYLIESVKNDLNIYPKIFRRDLTAYLNLNFFIGTKPEDLAERIFKAGIKQVNMSAWTSEQKDFTKGVIEECHKRGIAVYVWLELPMVTVNFWNEHPEWREITASGKEAQIDWRYLMALEDEDCFNAIKNYVKDLIKEFDWDGVDIAEIYFESPDRGIANPERFTPMHESFRKRFKDKYGVDPKDILHPTSTNYWAINKDMKEKLLNEREALITELHEKMLMVVEESKKEKPHLKTMVTMIDSLLDKEIARSIGVSGDKIIELQNKYNFTLQIEDPYSLWNYGPERYKIIGEEYKKTMEKDKNLTIDINVIDRYGEVYPSKKQRGEELVQLIYNGNRYTDGVTFYAIETMEDSDMQLTPFIKRPDIKIEQNEKDLYKVKGDKGFYIKEDTKEYEYYLDEKPWHFINEGEIFIPKGEHTLKRVKSSKKVNNSVAIMSDKINSFENSENKTKFSYESVNRVYVTLKNKPKTILIDGAKAEINVMELKDKGYTLVLPEGNKKVDITY